MLNQLYDYVGKSPPEEGSASAKALRAMLRIVSKAKEKEEDYQSGGYFSNPNKNTGFGQAGTSGAREKKLDFRYILKI